MEERLQKLISSCGVTSRRSAEKLILEGKVTVNGWVANLGDRGDLGKDEILVCGKALKRDEERSYYMLHKPRGYVTTLSDEKGRKTVADLMEGCGKRVWPVGRLDYQSEGLLIMTDDGALTQKLIHPSHEVEKEYFVWVTGDLECGVPRLSEPMTLDGELLSRARVKVLKEEGKSRKISMVIHQGKNRQIRRMCEQVGLDVVRLQRIREGNLSLDRGLAVGKWRPLLKSEVESMIKGK